MVDKKLGSSHMGRKGNGFDWGIFVLKNNRDG